MICCEVVQTKSKSFISAKKKKKGGRGGWGGQKGDNNQNSERKLVGFASCVLYLYDFGQFFSSPPIL